MWRFIITLFLFGTTGVFAQGWTEFARVKFKAKYYKEYDAYFLEPTFHTSIKALEGKEVELEGYFIPVEFDDKKVFMLSKYPYAQCFFCGAAGPESVAEVMLQEKVPRFKTDQFVRVRGILKLNGSDVNHMNFLIQQAQITKL